MGWFGPQSGVCTCCNDGPPPEDTCDFDCTGDEPEMLGVEVELGSTGTSGCTCSGEGTYLFPAPTYVQRPELSGNESNCLHCWNNIDLGTCCAFLQRDLIAEESQFGGLPADLIAPCPSNPDEFTGYSYGLEAQLYYDYFIYGLWTADLCVQFKSPNIHKYTFTVHGLTCITARAIDCETRYRRQWKMVKQPGSFPGPEGDDWCTWIAEWTGPWEYEPGYDGTECPPPDSECLGSAICNCTSGDIVWSGEFPITNCSEILSVRALTKGTVPAGISGECCLAEEVTWGGPFPGCYSYSGINIDWGCAPNYVNVNVVPAP